MAYLNFSTISQDKSKAAPVAEKKEQTPNAGAPGYHGKPKALQEKNSHSTEIVQQPSKGKFGFFKK